MEEENYEEYVPLKQRKSLAEIARRKRARVPEEKEEEILTYKEDLNVLNYKENLLIY
jgi:hypothetical protein